MDNGMIHVSGGREQDRVWFHHVTQKEMQVKTYELFITEIFHLIFLDHGWLQLWKVKSQAKGDYYIFF